MKFKDAFWEKEGCEKLRKLCHQGNEFCLEVAAVFHERAKIEQTYAESLLKLAAKAQKSLKYTLGTLESAWENTIQELENEAEVHRQLGIHLHDDLYKQVKVFEDTQTKTWKAVEPLVEKSLKTFADTMSDAAKAKRDSHIKTKEAQFMFERLEEAKAGKESRVLSEREISKMDTKSKRMGEVSLKADKEYRELYEKTERARLHWEAAMLKFCQTCEKLEDERLTHLQEKFSLYGYMLAAVVPQLQQNYENVKSEAQKIIPAEDVVSAANTRGEPRGPSEQILYDCYEEDKGTSMNSDFRRNGLKTKIQFLTETLEMQKKTRDGIKSLFEAYSETSDNYNEERHQEVAAQLTQANAIINSLQASVSKLEGALAESNGDSRPTNWLDNYVESSRDKQGMIQSVLKVPLDQVTNVQSNHDEGDNDVDDEFDDFPEPPVTCQCRAIYEFKAEESEQLDIRPGDIIKVTAKLDDGWWQGELNNRTGMFPASYVEEIG